MDLPNLTPDCQSCAALCCVLLAFDAGTAFGLSKPACAACPNLTDDNLCRIHDGLAAQGFAGCVAFDCQGAGQVVTGRLFQGRSWRDDQGLLPAMDAAFRVQRRLHEAMALLVQAGGLPLTAAVQAERQAVLATLATPWDAAALQGDAPSAALAQAAAFLVGLRGVTSRR